MPSLAKNTLFLTAASIAQKIIAFVYFTLIANTIGKASTGDYFLALSITTIFSVVADWGLTPVLIREMAHDPSRTVPITRAVLALKIPLILLGAAGSIILSLILGYSPLVVELVAVATFILAADALSLTFFGVLRGQQNLRYESLGIFIGQALTATIGLISLHLHPSLVVLILALLSGSVWNAIYSAVCVAKRLGTKILLPAFDGKLSKQLLRMSIAFALAAVFVKVYSYIDSLMLSLTLGNTAVGAYAVVYKITYAFQFLPLAFVGALYPAFASLHAKGKREELGHVFEDAMWYLMLLATPIVLGITTLADQIIPQFYKHGYGDAILPLQIEIFVLFVLFLDYPVGSLLNASRRTYIKTAIMGATMVVDAVSNAILIPRLGIPGASITAVIAFTFMLIAGLAYVPKLIDRPFRRLFVRLSPILLAGLAMAAVILLLKSSVHFFLLILVGAVVYIAALFLLRAVKVKHLRELITLMRRKGVPDVETASTTSV